MRRARVIARAHHDALVPEELPEEIWLRERFGLDGSVAACALPQADVAGAHLLVRPVHLHVAFDHLVLAPVTRLGIEAAEAEALAARANALLADDGLRLSVATADAWRLEALDVPAGHAELAALAALRVRSARMAAGRNVDAYQPSGSAARRWRQLSNLVQMAWFDDPVNVAREAAGRLAVNGLWLEGRAGAVAHRPFARVHSDDATLVGLARRSGAEVAPADARAPAPEALARGAAAADSAHASAADAVLLAPAFWAQAVSDGDLPAWEHAWEAFDRWFGARLEASPHIARRELRLVLTGERSLVELALLPGDRWRPWRRLHLGALLRETS